MWQVLAVVPHSLKQNAMCHCKVVSFPFPTLGAASATFVVDDLRVCEIVAKLAN